MCHIRLVPLHYSRLAPCPAFSSEAMGHDHHLTAYGYRSLVRIYLYIRFTRLAAMLYSSMRPNLYTHSKGNMTQTAEAVLADVTIAYILFTTHAIDHTHDFSRRWRKNRPTYESIVTARAVPQRKRSTTRLTGSDEPVHWCRKQTYRCTCKKARGRKLSERTRGGVLCVMQTEYIATHCSCDLVRPDRHGGQILNGSQSSSLPATHRLILFMIRNEVCISLYV